MSAYHTPVLLDESVSALITDTSGLYADATFGGGGHSAEILSRLSPRGRLIGFDRDSEAIANRIEDPRLTMVHGNFRFIRNFVELDRRQHAPGDSQAEESGRAGMKDNNDGVLDGILADLGVSSHQFDSAERGFSFRFEDAPLDMRMNAGDKENQKTAATVVNTYTEEELEKIFRLYGEVENSRALTRLIVFARASAPIRTTGELDAAIESVTPKVAPHKYLAKVYQALRIEVNDEMRSLEKFLEGASASLKKGGRLVVITYHSLEDRMVKNFIKAGNIEGELVKDTFGRVETPLRAVNRKPILPSEAEIAGNTRARSAKLRVAEKL
ncbi:MAG: 16S rRNA (cytosine(1402)-N(4))-methyltransferase RsmH [Bacteroidales bacterium]|nr:16S rRNA (cytosine(1402)-N(4))-methyltransferase RsmH [Bacteroidales bacterium]